MQRDQVAVILTDDLDRRAGVGDIVAQFILEDTVLVLQNAWWLQMRTTHGHWGPMEGGTGKGEGLSEKEKNILQDDPRAQHELDEFHERAQRDVENPESEWAKLKTSERIQAINNYKKAIADKYLTATEEEKKLKASEHMAIADEHLKAAKASHVFENADHPNHPTGEPNGHLADAQWHETIAKWHLGQSFQKAKVAGPEKVAEYHPPAHLEHAQLAETIHSGMATEGEKAQWNSLTDEERLAAAGEFGKNYAIVKGEFLGADSAVLADLNAKAIPQSAKNELLAGKIYGGNAGLHEAQAWHALSDEEKLSAADGYGWNAGISDDKFELFNTINTQADNLLSKSAESPQHVHDLVATGHGSELTKEQWKTFYSHYDVNNDTNPGGTPLYNHEPTANSHLGKLAQSETSGFPAAKEAAAELLTEKVHIAKSWEPPEKTPQEIHDIVANYEGGILTKDEWKTFLTHYNFDPNVEKNLQYNQDLHWEKGPTPIEYLKHQAESTGGFPELKDAASELLAGKPKTPSSLTPSSLDVAKAKVDFEEKLGSYRVALSGGAPYEAVDEAGRNAANAYSTYLGTVARNRGFMNMHELQSDPSFKKTTENKAYKAAEAGLFLSGPHDNHEKALVHFDEYSALMEKHAKTHPHSAEGLLRGYNNKYKLGVTDKATVEEHKAWMEDRLARKPSLFETVYKNYQEQYLGKKQSFQSSHIKAFEEVMAENPHLVPTENSEKTEAEAIRQKYENGAHGTPLTKEEWKNLYSHYNLKMGNLDYGVATPSLKLHKDFSTHLGTPQGEAARDLMAERGITPGSPVDRYLDKTEKYHLPEITTEEHLAYLEYRHQHEGLSVERVRTDVIGSASSHLDESGVARKQFLENHGIKNLYHATPEEAATALNLSGSGDIFSSSLDRSVLDALVENKSVFSTNYNGGLTNKVREHAAYNIVGKTYGEEIPGTYNEHREKGIELENEADKHPIEKASDFTRKAVLYKEAQREYAFGWIKANEGTAHGPLATTKEDLLERYRGLDNKIGYLSDEKTLWESGQRAIVDFKAGRRPTPADYNSLRKFNGSKQLSEASSEELAMAKAFPELQGSWGGKLFPEKGPYYQTAHEMHTRLALDAQMRGDEEASARFEKHAAYYQELSEEVSKASLLQKTLPEQSDEAATALRAMAQKQKDLAGDSGLHRTVTIEYMNNADLLNGMAEKKDAEFQQYERSIGFDGLSVQEAIAKHLDQQARGIEDTKVWNKHLGTLNNQQLQDYHERMMTHHLATWNSTKINNQLDAISLEYQKTAQQYEEIHRKQNELRVKAWSINAEKGLAAHSPEAEGLLRESDTLDASRSALATRMGLIGKQQEELAKNLDSIHAIPSTPEEAAHHLEQARMHAESLRDVIPGDKATINRHLAVIKEHQAAMSKLNDESYIRQAKIDALLDERSNAYLTGKGVEDVNAKLQPLFDEKVLSESQRDFHQGMVDMSQAGLREAQIDPIREQFQDRLKKAQDLAAPIKARADELSRQYEEYKPGIEEYRAHVKELEGQLLATRQAKQEALDKYNHERMLAYQVSEHPEIFSDEEKTAIFERRHATAINLRDADNRIIEAQNALKGSRAELARYDAMKAEAESAQKRAKVALRDEKTAERGLAHYDKLQRSQKTLIGHQEKIQKAVSDHNEEQIAKSYESYLKSVGVTRKERELAVLPAILGGEVQPQLEPQTHEKIRAQIKSFVTRAGGRLRETYPDIKIGNQLNDLGDLNVSVHSAHLTSAMSDEFGHKGFSATLRTGLKSRISDRISKNAGISTAEANAHIHEWAGWGDANGAPGLSMLQHVAGERFGVPVVREDEYFSLKPSASEKTKYQQFLDAEMKSVQDGWDHGDSLVLYRGIGFYSHNIPDNLEDIDMKEMDETWEAATVPHDPLSSWSIDPQVARNFANSKDIGFLMRARVPRGKIAGNSLDGLGCSTEGEYLVIGGNLDVAVTRITEY